ncbi:CrcB family protein [Actinotalea ferrariae]|uniref:FluC/FEX family fluoride channel n=1 Tax=Actinotalea ferrariae TaxID=1386098 RepID=UPI001C8B7B56|nr:CrcB family protein [Actinotalea ferrariae]MBX9245460.1 CrcB family protein [Actinotalea ferrariae]
MTADRSGPPPLVMVAVGGALGTGARLVVSGLVPTAANGFPTATLVENLVGAFLLGLLLEVLLRRGEEDARGRLVRLGLGTGALGGFTTFSSLAIELQRLLADGAFAVAGAYAAASLALGLLACLAGVALGARSGRTRRRATT